MRKFGVLFLVFALLLTACATPAENTNTTVPVATEVVITEVAATEVVATEAVATVAMATEAAATEAVATESVAATEAVAATEVVATEAMTGSVALPETGGGTVYHIIPEESALTYEVGETFLNQNNKFNTAIGSTSGITGSVTLDPANPQSAQLSPLSFDISLLTSDSARRDDALRERFLLSNQFPIATFTPAEITGLPENYTPGEEITFQVSGDLQIREVTQPVTFDVTARLEGDTLTGSASGEIMMSDFGFGPISIAGILNTEDLVTLKMDFVARPQ